MDLGAGAAGTDIAHGPPVVLFAEAQDALRRRAPFDPEALGLVVVGVDREPEPLNRQAQFVDQQMPGKVDGFLLEVVAKGEVAQHLEKGVVARAGTDVLQVVVLAADAHALLRCGGAVVGPLLQAHEDILELDHAGVDQQQRRIVVRHQIAAVYNLVVQLVKVVEPELTNFIGRESFHVSTHRPKSTVGRRSSGGFARIFWNPLCLYSPVIVG